MKYLNKPNQPWYGWYEKISSRCAFSHQERMVNLMMPGFPVSGNIWSRNAITSSLLKIQISNKSLC